MTQFILFVRSLWALFPFPVGPFAKFMAFLQSYYLYEVFATNDTGGISFTLGSFFLVFWSLVTVIITFQVLANVSNRRWVSLFLSGLGLIVYSVSAAYTFGSHDSLNWNVLAENFSIAFTPESLTVILYSLDIKGLQYGAIIFLIFTVLEVRYRTVSKATHGPITHQKRWVAVLLYVLLILLPIEAMDPFLNFMRSGVYYYRNKQALNVTVLPNSYPLIQPFSFTHETGVKQKRPHVFLILVESLNADVVGQRSSDGKPYTPFLNQLQKNSVTTQSFYGNSIQTAKGHFSTFFSMIPSLRSKVFVKHEALRIDSIASVLGRYGYYSVAFAAHGNRNFDNVPSFLLSHGYDAYETVDAYTTPEDAKDRLDWGVKDEVFFQRFFDYFDEHVDLDRPGFFTLLTIANHFPFNTMVPNDRLVYPEPQSIQEDYANSIRLVDRGIQRFYQALDARGLTDDSLVIITSDHAFPLGQHGNYHLEAGYHEDSFRIPFFLTWPNELTPKQLMGAYSQLDIKPTILDLLGISLPSTHIQGQSVFQKGDAHPIYLVQPYAKHFSVVRYPYKYRFFAKIEQEYVYNLRHDPMEQNSIIDDLSPTLLRQFRSDLKHMYLSQALLQKNQIQPSP